MRMMRWLSSRYEHGLIMRIVIGEKAMRLPQSMTRLNGLLIMSSFRLSLRAGRI